MAQLAGAAKYTDASLQKGQCPECSEAPGMIELWGMRNTPLLPSFPDPL